MKPLGIYLHIPFCKSKCAYCDFYSVAGRAEDMEGYVRALEAQLALWGQRAGDYLVDTVYVGGGTPSWFGAERVLRLLEAVKGSFALSPDCEITMEANPDSVTEEGLTQLRRGGVNRISLGVQSAEEGVLHTAGRPHSFHQAQQAVAWARAAGFQNLSLDLIYGLPGQTMAGWQQTVEQILALEPEHLSCYGLKVEEGTPFWQRSPGDFPDEDTQAEEYLWVCHRLEQAGFHHYEISNFAQPGKFSRHNVKYWRLGEYLGFGPAAHSDFGGVRFGYERDLAAWLRGETPRSEESVITPAERIVEYVMLGLRLSRGICREEYESRGGIHWPALQKKLESYQKYALLEETAGRWHCTPQGFLVSNRILAELLEVEEG
jgi:oxygen-independent coproporphyrinogen-3 oxidase